MSKAKHVTVTRAETKLLVSRVTAKLEPGRLMAGSKCDACGKVLEETEATIRGYASGQELGLCRRCSSFVNTEAAINQAIKEGHEVDPRAAIVVPERKERDHGPM